MKMTHIDPSGETPKFIGSASADGVEHYEENYIPEPMPYQYDPKLTLYLDTIHDLSDPTSIRKSDLYGNLNDKPTLAVAKSDPMLPTIQSATDFLNASRSGKWPIEIDRTSLPECRLDYPWQESDGIINPITGGQTKLYKRNPSSVSNLYEYLLGMTSTDEEDRNVGEDTAREAAIQDCLQSGFEIYGTYPFPVASAYYFEASGKEMSSFDEYKLMVRDRVLIVMTLLALKYGRENVVRLQTTTLRSSKKDSDESYDALHLLDGPARDNEVLVMVRKPSTETTAKSDGPVSE